MSHLSGMNQNKRLLVIAYHFPPVRVSSGIQRTLKFCTYLQQFGWDPLVLTIVPSAYEVTNPDQIDEIPKDVVVERAFGLDTARHLAIAGRYFRWTAQPDRWVSWWPWAVRKGVGMIRKYRPAAIMLTYPIATAHRIGLSLHKQSGLPWVADFRDSMTEPGYPRDETTWKVHRRLEEQIVKHCSRAVFTTAPTMSMYAERYPQFEHSRWAVIENGFDEENFAQAESGLDPSPLGRSGQITLVHSGILYPIERDPSTFFSVLATLKASGRICADNLQVLLRATGSDGLHRAQIDALNIADIVRLEPVIAYREALREMLRADGLLLFQGSVCNHQVPAKIYEYYRAGKPILAVVDPKGISASMLQQAGVTHLADIADAGQIAQTVLALLAALRNGRSAGVARKVADAHSRRSRTLELAHLLDQVVNR